MPYFFSCIFKNQMFLKTTYNKKEASAHHLCCASNAVLAQATPLNQLLRDDISHPHKRACKILKWKDIVGEETKKFFSPSQNKTNFYQFSVVLTCWSNAVSGYFPPFHFNACHLFTTIISSIFGILIGPEFHFVHTHIYTYICVCAHKMKFRAT